METMMYTPGANAGTAILGTAGSGQAGTIISGALEGSNVDLTAQMVNLIDYQADYQANSKSIETGNTHAPDRGEPDKVVDRAVFGKNGMQDQEGGFGRLLHFEG